MLQASECSLFTYYNFEAVPEAVGDGEADCFRAVTLFKRCRGIIPETAATVTRNLDMMSVEIG